MATTTSYPNAFCLARSTISFDLVYSHTTYRDDANDEILSCSNMEVVTVAVLLSRNPEMGCRGRTGYNGRAIGKGACNGRQGKFDASANSYFT